MSKRKRSSAAQDFLGVEEIKEGIVTLKDGSLRGILYISSQNFALKSIQEQDSIIYQFQNFLNSLDFPCQLVVQSRRVNMTGYFDTIRDLSTKQNNPLLKVQMQEYLYFIEGLVKSGVIMSKQFFVAVPFYFTELKGIGAKNKFSTHIDEEKFQIGKNQLWQRMEFVALGLQRCGLQSVALNTTEIIDLLWSIYHTKEAEQGYYPEIPPELTI